MAAMTPEEVELRNFRRDLDLNFKPLFEKYDEEGIVLSELRGELEEEGLLEHIPRDRMDELLNLADRDGDKHVTYKEFVHMMTYDLARSERRPFKRVMRAAIADIVPRRMREDFLANYTCCPPPLFIPIISAAEVIIFIIYALELKDTNNPVTATSGVAMYSPLVYKPTRRYEVWRFVSYMFMHQGYVHIVSNLVMQLLFGLSLEVVHKWWRVGLVYTLGAMAGGLAHSVTDFDVGLVGASGGVYAILGAHVAAIITNWREMNYKCMDPEEMEDNACCGIWRILLSAPVRLAIILLLVVPDTSLAIYRRITEPEEFKIGVTAHVGGFLAGVFLGILILRNINRLTWERALGWVTLAGFLAFVAFCSLFNALYDGYPKTDWSGY